MSWQEPLDQPRGRLADLQGSVDELKEREKELVERCADQSSKLEQMKQMMEDQEPGKTMQRPTSPQTCRATTIFTKINTGREIVSGNYFGSFVTARLPHKF